MVSEKKLTANRANATRSTGPKTAAGKAVSKKNAIRHGLRSLLPVLPGETAKDWNQHQSAMVEALSPVGAVESELAGRVAELTWRLRRVSEFECGVASAGIAAGIARARGEIEDVSADEALQPTSSDGDTWADLHQSLESAQSQADSHKTSLDLLQRLRDEPDDHRFTGDEAWKLLDEASGRAALRAKNLFDIWDEGFLRSIGVPTERQDAPSEWDGWNARMVRAGVKVIAEAHKMTATKLINRLIREASYGVTSSQCAISQLNGEMVDVRKRLAAAESLARSRAVLPGTNAIDKVMRYEAHLGRQITQTLQLLERLQTARAGKPVQPPVAQDVAVTGGMPATPLGSSDQPGND
jgi:hypothetical protein